MGQNVLFGHSHSNVSTNSTVYCFYKLQNCTEIQSLKTGHVPTWCLLKSHSEHSRWIVLCCAWHCACTNYWWIKRHVSSSIATTDGAPIVLLEVNYFCQVWRHECWWGRHTKALILLISMSHKKKKRPSATDSAYRLHQMYSSYHQTVYSDKDNLQTLLVGYKKIFLPMCAHAINVRTSLRSQRVLPRFLNWHNSQASMWSLSQLGTATLRCCWTRCGSGS